MARAIGIVMSAEESGEARQEFFLADSEFEADFFRNSDAVVDEQT